MTRTSWDPDSEDAKPYFAFARSYNSAQHSSRREDKANCSLAKPVLVFDADTADLQWRIRTHVAMGQQSVRTSLAALMPPLGGSSSQGPSSETLRPRPAGTETKGTLTGAVDELVELYEGLHNAGDQQKMLRTLHRLQVYMTALTLDVDVDDGAQQTAEPIDAAAQQSSAPQVRAQRLSLDADTVASYVAFFRQVQARLVAAQGVPLPPEDTAAIITRLKDMSRFFREVSLTLPDISVKLATKPSTHTKAQDELIARLTTLTHQGLARLTPETSRPLVHQFLCAFAHASRFWTGCVGRSGEGALSAVLKAVISHLKNIQRSEHYPLFDFYLLLYTRVIKQGEDSFVYTLELLLRDEGFLGYLAGIVDTDESVFVDLSLQHLMRSRHAALWRAGAIALLDRPLQSFKAALDACVAVSASGPLAPERINAIFDSLQTQLVRLRSAAGPGLNTTDSTPIQARYHAMMDSLARANALSVLAEHPRTAAQRQHIVDVFQALHSDLPFDDLHLPTLLSNAAFFVRAYMGRKGPCSIQASLRVAFKRAVDKLLQHTYASPVNDVALFYAQLDRLARDFSRGPVALRGAILKALGEVSRPGPRCVEAWLQDTIIPDTHQIMRLVLSCYPFIWRRETFAAPQLLADRVVLSAAGGLHVTTYRPGEIMLGDLVDPEHGEVVAIEPDAAWFSATSWEALCESVRPIGQHVLVKQAISAMVDQFYAFKRLNLSGDKAARVNALLSRVQAPSAADLCVEPSAGADERSPESLVTAFKERMDTLNVLLRSIAPFAQVHLEDEATKRFFRRGALSANGQRFLATESREDVAPQADLHAAIVDRLFDVGFRAVEQLVLKCTSAAALRQSVDQIDGIVARELDMQSFKTELMVDAFNGRHRHAEGSRSSIQLDHHAVEALRHQLYNDAEGMLKEAGITYIMPNQALAIALCRHPSLCDAHVMLKMGTGQGKSFVIAAAALQEAIAARDEASQFVFVLTGFDHLAQGDHQTGRSFFAAEGIKSACLVNVSDLDSVDADTKIIYASARTLQAIVQAALIKPVLHTLDPSRPQAPRHLAFLNKLFSGHHRFILDEYDLVLNDLDFSRGTVTLFSSAVLDRSFVTAHEHQAYAPSFQKLVLAQADVCQHVTDKADGHQGSNTSTPYLMTADGPTYRLRNGGLRMACLLRHATRIIGLSGTSDGDAFADVPELAGQKAAYFELPSSRDPDAFGTTIVHRKEELDGMPGAWRTTHLEFADGAEAAYVQAIVQEVRRVRTPQAVAGDAGVSLRRPILIFVDPAKKDLFASLKVALVQEVGEHLKVKLSDAQIQGASLQEMGLAGQVTLVTLNCGRGVDIRVSRDIPDSLHVVIATDVPSERLLTQMIGRTARNCRSGSYATITMGPLVTRAARREYRCGERMLHEMTQHLVANLSAPKPDWGTHQTGPTYMRRWLMLASEVQWGSQAVGESLRGSFVTAAVAS